MGSTEKNVYTYFSDKKLRKKLKSDDTPKVIESGKQGKHIKGHNNYIEGNSYLTVSETEAQELVNKYAGTGDIKRDSKGRWTNKEFVTADKKIGVVVDSESGKETSTARFSIHYSRKGVHIVPRKEID
ncbi:polymorphic toxin type 50 domain-containing protein [bacterium]|nr:polymorphic toxin type 50 domain-containing protein [bacterium]